MNRGLLVVQPLSLPGDESGDSEFIAVNNSQVGIGDTVLVLSEGSGARQVLETPDACIICGFRRKPTTDSCSCRPVKPAEAVHFFNSHRVN